MDTNSGKGKFPRGNTKWEWRRANDPVLELTPLKDNLSWLMAGEPDPEISVKFWAHCAVENDVSKICEYLQKFMKEHRPTFVYSGWVRTVVGRVVLEDSDAAKKLIKAYWKKPRPTRSSENAYRALRRVQGRHQAHWLCAAQRMQEFRDAWIRQSRGKFRKDEDDNRFVSAASQAYKDIRLCNCLGKRGLVIIADAVLDHPKAAASTIVDCALANLFRTSQGTLAHLRAQINRNYRTR